MSKNEVQRSFRLPAELDAKLVKKAEQLDRSVSWVVVQALKELLGKKR